MKQEKITIIKNKDGSFKKIIQDTPVMDKGILVRCVTIEIPNIRYNEKLNKWIVCPFKEGGNNNK